MTAVLQPNSTERDSPSLWLVMLLTAMAGGMGWGIRGQYGHETGAMIAGVLVGFVLVLMFCAHTKSLFAARAVAMCALGVSIGGSMTYAQTVGLTHDSSFVGSGAALRWGLLGLSIKGAIWVGFAAAFLAMALGGIRYRPVELALGLLVMLFLYYLGIGLLNEPYDPANKILPTIYFSADWFWNPDGDVKPRREIWGGLLVALVTLYLYAGWVRNDRLVRRLTLWGAIGGGLGFPGGQCIQAFHAWNAKWLDQGSLGDWSQMLNWWNMMETTFGAVFGAILALGLWLNRHLIREPDEIAAPELKPATEWLLVVVHVVALLVWNFGSFTFFDHFADTAIAMVLIPVIAVSAGRLWPYLVSLPIVALPIAGKTLRELSYRQEQFSVPVGWMVLVILPTAVMFVAAMLLARDAENSAGAGRFARWGLLLTTWLFFGLNYAFFDFPWPWQTWTGRTPNAVIFLVCAAGLTCAALFSGRQRGHVL